MIKNNNIHHNKQRGIVVCDHGLGLFKGNQIHSNLHSGVKIRTSANPKFIKNNIFNGQSAGLLVHNGGRGFFKNNFIFNNIFSGIEIRNGGDPHILDCHIHSGFGISPPSSAFPSPLFLFLLSFLPFSLSLSLVSSFLFPSFLFPSYSSLLPIPSSFFPLPSFRPSLFPLSLSREITVSYSFSQLMIIEILNIAKSFPF